MSPKPAVVFLHGTTSGGWVFAPVKKELSKRGRDVIAPTYARFGTGDLDKGVEEIVAAMKRSLSDAREIDLVGHSLGGLMALRVAAHPAISHRVRRLVGLGACYRGVTPKKHLCPKLLGRIAPAFLQIEAPIAEPVIPKGVEVFSVVSTADTVVPESSARLGAVTTIEGVLHPGLAALPDLIAGLLE